MWLNFLYRISVIKTILPFASGIKRFVLFSTLAGIVINITRFIQPHFYKVFIDDIVLGGQIEKMVGVVCGYLGVFCIEAGMSYLQNYAKYSINNNLLLRIKTRLLSSFFAIPLDEYQRTNVGDMKLRLEDDTRQIQEFADKQSINYVLSILTIVVCSVCLMVINWKLALFSLVTIPLTVWVDYMLGKRESILQEENRKNNKDLHNWLQESLEGWREIRALCLEKMQERQYLKHLNRFAMYYSKWINYWTARVLVIPKIRDDLFMVFGLYFLGGLLIIRGEFSIGELLVFASYYKILSGSTRTIALTEGDLVSNKPYSDRLMEILVKLTASEQEKACTFTNGDIIFANVAFHYADTDKQIFSNLNLNIKKGERVGIIGKSGCGKTTLLKLLIGLLEPTSGSVSIAGIKHEDLDIRALHNRLGYMMQECTLFNTTLRENMKYAKEDATDNEIIEACRKACIYDFIFSLPSGLDTIIGENGIKLSGGQRQRIALAKIFLKEADIYIFDEATSALDPHNETLIYDAIQQIAQDKTVIIVSHRESSIRICDRVINLDKLQQTLKSGEGLTLAVK